MSCFYTEEHQGQVVVGLCTFPERFNGLAELADDLLGIKGYRLGHQLDQPLVSKSLMDWVHGLVQTVGIDQHLTFADILNGLALENEILP